MSSRSKLLVVFVVLCSGLGSVGVNSTAANVPQIPSSAVDCGLLRQSDEQLCLKTAQDFWIVLRAEVAAANDEDPLGVLSEMDQRTKLFVPS